MIINKRQISIDCANVPSITYQKEINIKGYEIIKDVFVEAFMKKIFYHYKYVNEKTYQDIINKDRERFNDCVEQTITFLKSIKALKSKPENIKEIKLWQKAIKMQPFYEGISSQLKTTLIRHHCPFMYNAIVNEKKCYSHQTLTDIGEAVLYIMEYFTKKNLLYSSDEIIKDLQKNGMWKQPSKFKLSKVEKEIV